MRRSPYQAIAAILSMFITFLLAGIFFLATGASIVILGYFESKPQITVFFTDKATGEEIQGLERTLAATGKIASTKYVSKQDALAIYQEQNKNDPLLLEMVTADILPASIEVSAKDPKFLKDLEQLIREKSNVEEVVYQRDVVESLLLWTNAIRTIGGILAVLLAVNALLITMTVVTMKIALKKDEVEVLKLVGASSWYIRSPFLLEGGSYGAFGAAIASIVILGQFLWLRPYLMSFLGVIPTMNALLGSVTSATFLLSAIAFGSTLVFLGFLLGGLGSLIALGRYIRI